MTWVGFGAASAWLQLAVASNKLKPTLRQLASVYAQT